MQVVDDICAKQSMVMFIWKNFLRSYFLFSIPTDVVSCKHWLASGSNESVIHVHDLNSMLGTNVFSSSHGNSWKAFSVLCFIVILQVLRVFSLRK